MELIERPELLNIHYLNEMKFSEFKQYTNASNDDKRKTQFDIMKSFCKTHIKTGCNTKRIYSQSNNIGYGRLFCGNSVQNIPKPIRGFVMKNTTDIDMCNCHFTIAKYLCELNNILCPNLTYYVNNRDKVLKDFGKASNC